MLVLYCHNSDNLVISENNCGVDMAFFNITSKNIKLTIVDDKSKGKRGEEYLVEILVQRSFLCSMLTNLSMTNETNFDGDITLTKREKQVLDYLSRGNNNTQIAKRLNVSVHTTKLHIHNIFNKLSVQDRTEAVVKAIKYNLIKP